MYKNKKMVGLLLLLCLAVSGCGGSSDTADSSTNNTEEDAKLEGAPPVEEGINRQPSAQISVPQGTISGETVTLDGSASSDPDGDTLNYLWIQTQGEAISLRDNSDSTFSFIAPTVTQPATFTFQLSVNDGELSNSASIDIQVSPLVDTTAPSIVSRTPSLGETGIATMTTISVTFDEPLLENLIGNQSLTISENGVNLAGNIVYDGNARRIMFTPGVALSENTAYTVTLASVQDLVGNGMPGESWDFTTGSTDSQYNLGQTDQGTIDLCMDIGDKQLLTLVNNARVVARSCGTTPYVAAPLLSWHCNLEQASQGHSTSMADNDFFSHTGLDGSNAGERITAAGYIWRAYGENISAGYSTNEDAVNSWLNSPDHCANLMNPIFSEMGVASAENLASHYRIYWTQNFADH